MSTPVRTPQRPYIHSIDTSASRHLKGEYQAYSGGWHTPLSAQERRRPSLSYSLMSEPSPTSLPTTPGYCTSSSHGSYQSVYLPNNIAPPMRAMNYIKSDPDLVRSLQNHSLTYDMMAGDDKYQQQHIIPANDAKYQSNMVMSPLEASFNDSFTSNSSASWQPLQQAPLQICTQPILFRPSSVQTMDSFGSVDQLNKGMYGESLMPQLQSAVSTCPSPASFDSIHGQSFLNPHQLIVPSDVQEHDGYGYVHAMDSSMTTPIEPPNMHSASFDSFSSMSPWSQIEPASPINEYTLPGDELVGANSMMMKDDAMQNMLSQHDFDQHAPITPRRSRLRGKLGSAKRCRTSAHPITHRSWGVEVAIDQKGLKLDPNGGRYVKKNDGIETKRWKCTYEGCESRSARKEHLRRHELSHMPDKQFHCNLPKCNRSITRSDNLIQHLMTHVRPAKPGKRNNHYSQRAIERMVLETMKDNKLAERTITNFRKAVEREQDKWPRRDEEDLDWDPSDARGGSLDDESVENLKYES